MSEEFKPKITGEEFVVKLKEAGFTSKTIDALHEEDIVSDTALKILSEKDIDNIADNNELTIGQKRLLVEFAASLRPKKTSDSSIGRSSKEVKDGPRKRTRSKSPLSNRRRHEGDRLNPDQSSCIGVFNIPFTVTPATLTNLFSRMGDVKDVKVIYDRVTGESRGFAFVYFVDIQAAVKAKEECAGLTIEGQAIRTEFSITKRAHSPTPGEYLGRSSYPDRRRPPPPPPVPSRSYDREPRGRPERYEPYRTGGGGYPEMGPMMGRYSYY